jgi:predicted anti-sigma-YlaC factor YlaD
MIALLQRLASRSRHARPETLSRYLDGELTQPERLALEAHLDECPDCRGLLESLTRTLHALRSMPSTARAGLADSLIAALRAQSASHNAPVRLARGSGSPALTVVPDLPALASDTVSPATPGARVRSASSRIARAVLGYCMRRPQLRLTLPLGLSVGIALSLINKGYMIFNGRVDAEMCAVCALDFVIPFLALNIGLLLTTRMAGRRRS